MGRLAATGRAILGAYASVLFASEPVVGALLLVATCARPASALAGLLAVLAATATATALGYRVDAVRRGHYGFNALLVGLAAALHHDLDGRLVVLVVLAGVAAAMLTAVLGDLLHRAAGLPVLALPFVLLVAALIPALDALPAGTPGVLDHVWLPAGLLDAVPAPLTWVFARLGAILFAANPLAGALVLLGLAIHSRIAAALALLGLLAGALMAEVLGVTAAATEIGMAYNAALTAAAIGAFAFVPGRAALLAGGLAALLAAWLAVGLAAVLAHLGLPLVAWPFVLVSLGATRALHLRAADRPPFASPLPGLSPEANLAYAATRRARFGLPGPVQLLPPFFGTWTVSQGVDGAHTHQGPWAHALDFEVTDADGFPFRGDGHAAEDFACFGLPVCAPAAGTIAVVHDGQADQAPGGTDTARPWGNAVILQLAPECFVVLAHLRRGSIAVSPGQWVAAGQPLAACGASGRSPRPHLHLQVQRTTELGAAAIPFTLVHYVVETPAGGASRPASRRYVHAGIPTEGTRLASPAPSPIVEAFTALPPGQLVELERDGGERIRLVSELSLLGERSLRDLDRGDRLYFTVLHGNLTFTSHTGPADAPLRALLLALPRLPSVAGAAAFVDHPPAAAMLSPSARLVHDVVRVVGDPLEVRADVDLAEDGDGLIVTTTAALGLRGHARPRTRGRVELDAAGLRSIEVRDEDGALRLRARRAA
jgi:urea transporter